MRTTTILVALVLAGAAGAAAEQWIWGRTRVLSTQALWGSEGPIPRFQVSYLGDMNNPETCVMSIFDTETQRLSTTQVHPASCQ